MNKKIVIAIPVYNEEDKIVDTIKGIESAGFRESIVIINDGSTDNTLKCLDELKIPYIDLKKNRGKGYGMGLAIKDLDYDILVFLDGDLGTSSCEVKSLIDPILDGQGDISIAKFKSAKELTDKKGGFGLVKNLAKGGVKFFTGTEIDTSLSGQRAYTKESLEAISYIPNNYGIEIAMTIQTLKAGFEIIEIPVNMTHRFTERNIKGFIHRGKQFKDILWTLVKMYFKGYRR